MRRMGLNQHANVTWYCNVVDLGDSSLSVGYCERGHGIAFITLHTKKDLEVLESLIKKINPSTKTLIIDADHFTNLGALAPLIITDVVFNEHKCKDARWCLNLKCPLNKAELKYLTKYAKSPEELEKLHNNLEKITNALNLESKEELIIIFPEPPISIRIE
jgi:hypothetical protein